jgi:hypothetical protein
MVFEDAALLYKLLTRRDIYLLDEVVADYRIRANSMSYTQDSRMAPFLRWAWRVLPLDPLRAAPAFCSGWRCCRWCPCGEGCGGWLDRIARIP